MKPQFLNPSKMKQWKCPKCGSHHFRMMQTDEGDYVCECPDCRSHYGPLVQKACELESWTPADIVSAEQKMRENNVHWAKEFKRPEVVSAAAPEPESRELAREWDRVKIEELPINPKLVNALKAVGVRMIGQLLRKTPEELQKVKWFGPETVLEVERELGALTGQHLRGAGHGRRDEA